VILRQPQCTRRQSTSGANPQQPLGAGKHNAPHWCGAFVGQRALLAVGI